MKDVMGDKLSGFKFNGRCLLLSLYLFPGLPMPRKVKKSMPDRHLYINYCVVVIFHLSLGLLIQSAPYIRLQLYVLSKYSQLSQILLTAIQSVVQVS